MHASTNSANSRSSKKPRRLPAGGGVVLLFAAVLSASAVWWFATAGYTLYYGDAEAHLNIARRIWDNREPAYREFGTVWLPLPHALMLPFSLNDSLWRTGLAGAIPSALCFVLACWFFFRSLRSTMESTSAAFAGVTVLAWNPNLVYLQSAPMTEALFLACLSGLLLATIKDRPVLAGLCTLAATLTRYEGWFLIPAVFAYFLLKGSAAKRFLRAVTYGAISSVGPVYWMLHNWWLFGSATYFYDGPWSAKAIYARQLAEGMTRYPADGNWIESFRYFLECARLSLGETLLAFGIAGAIYACFRNGWPALLLSLPPMFYLWSLHASGTPIFVPTLWPHSYYNTRYALAILPLAAFGVAALVRRVPRDYRTLSAIGAIVICLLPWITVHAGIEQWVCWRESQVNSEARRQWTVDAGNYMHTQYTPGDGIWYNFGDLTAILRFARIPLRETLHEGNELDWYRTVARPDLFLKEKWVITFSDGAIAKALVKEPYDKVAAFQVLHSDGKRFVEIYRRRTPGS